MKRLSRAAESFSPLSLSVLQIDEDEFIFVLLAERGGRNSHRLLLVLHPSAVLSDCFVPRIIQTMDGSGRKYAFSLRDDHCEVYADDILWQSSYDRS